METPEEEIRNVAPEGLINVGVGEDLAINDLATLIQEVVGHEGPIEHDRSKPDGTPRKLVDTSRMEASSAGRPRRRCARASSRRMTGTAPTRRSSLRLEQRVDLVRRSCHKLWKGRCLLKTTYRDRIVIDPEVHFGKPCVAETRIPVEDVLDLLVQEGIPFPEIASRYYPDLDIET